MSTTSQLTRIRERQIYERRWAILAIMCLALVVTGLDTLIVTVALPSIQAEVGVTVGQLQWVVAAYSLAFAAPLLFVGSLADRYGRRMFFMIGMVTFLVGSLIAAFAPSAFALIGARVVMGLGAAMIMPSTLALIRHIFPAEERGKAIGIWVGMASLGVPLGPIIGGVLLERFSWGSVFLINVPLVAIAIVGCTVLIPESKKAERMPLDFVGLLLSVIGPLLLIYGIIDAPNHGWDAARTIVLIILGLAFTTSFVWWERRTTSPMLSQAVFADRRFGGPLITIATVFFGVFGCLFIVTHHLQYTLGYSPLEAGLHMLAMCSAVFVAPIAPKLVERFSIGRVTPLGPTLVAAGLAILAIGQVPSSQQIIASLALLGLGIGFGAPPSVDSIIESTPKEQTGAGSAVADVAMQFGGALGIAVMGSAASISSSAEAPNLALPAILGTVLTLCGAISVRSVLRREPLARPHEMSTPPKAAFSQLK